MKRIIALALFVTAVSLAQAEWFSPNLKIADTNNHPAQANEKTTSVFTNAVRRLAARGTVGDLYGLDRQLPAASTARIEELARGLEHDWRKCFDFVRNNIAFSYYSGIMRGAERTLIDREGNDADQSLLLIALLRASGYTATVIYEPLVKDSNGNITSGFHIPLRNFDGKTPYNAADWIGGVDNVIYSDASVLNMVQNLFGRTDVECISYKGIEIAVPHYWVSLTVNGVTRYLDPSFKPAKVTAPRNIRSGAGYSQSELFAAAGGTMAAGLSVRNLSKYGLSAKLDALCSNLRAAWSNSNEAAEFFTGSRKIVERTDDEYFHGGYFSETPIDLLVQPASYKNNLRTKVVLTCDGAPLPSFWLDEVGLRNIWFTTVAVNQSSVRNTMYLDDTQLFVSTASSNSESAALRVAVQHLSPTTLTYGLKRGNANAYSLVVGFAGDAKNGMRRFAADEAARLKAQGLSDAVPRMLAASLYMQGQQWLSQCAMTKKLMNSVVSGMWQHEQYTIGISGHSGSPFVDMGNCIGNSRRYGGYPSPYIFFSSALEHSVGEQMNGVDSVSTIKILDLANQRGDTIYFVTSQNVDTVMSSLVNYSEGKKSEFRESAMGGSMILLPRNGQTTLNRWSGTGYVEHRLTENGMSVGMIISGGMNGGYSTYDFITSPTRTTLRMGSDLWRQYFGSGKETQGDPVAMPAGSFLDGKTDLVLCRNMPLAWSRTYDSSDIYGDAGLGLGWTHCYNASVSEITDIDASFGRSSVDAVIPTVVAMVVADDMMVMPGTWSNEENARRWMIAAMAAQWWTERLNGTSVAVKAGGRSICFHKRPDGSFEPYPGETAELAKTNGVYVLKERLGSTYLFNWQDKLERVIDSSGNETRLFYGYGPPTNAMLTRVENDFNAAIDIEWSGIHIAKVTDSAGRSVEYTYESPGCLTAVKDVRGKTWTIAYDPVTHLLTSKTNPDGQREVFNVYNAYGQVTNQISDVGGVWKFGYADNTVAWTKDALGNVLTQYFDENGRSVRTVNYDGTETCKSYDGYGNPVMQVDEAGYVTYAAYDANGNLSQTIKGSGALRNTTTHVHDDRHRLVASTNALGREVRFVYDLTNHLIKTIQSDGRSLENDWNSNGTLAEVRSYAASGELVVRRVMFYNSYGLLSAQTIYGKGLPAAGISTSQTYSPQGLPISQTDANGNVTCMEYDAAGQVLAVTDPQGNVARMTYTDSGYLQSTTDALGRTTTYRVTPSGKVAATIFPDGTISTNRYDAMDQLVGTTDVRGATVSIVRDALGRAVETRTASGSSSVVFDVRGNVVESTNAAGVVSFAAYDELNRATETRNALGAAWGVSYDLLDRPVATVNPLGRRRTTSYDIAGRKVATFVPSGAKDAFGYDAAGNMTSYTNAENHVYWTGYDALGRVVAATNTLGVEVCHNAYDAAGNLVSSVDGNGATTVLAYDSLNRLTSKSGSGFLSTFAYNAVGNVTAVENSVARETFAYDVCDNLVAATAVFGSKIFQLTYERDVGGLITNITYAAGKRLDREYDTDGRLVKVKDWLGHVWRFAYDGEGKMTEAVSPNGIVSTYSYDAAGQLSAWRIGDIAGRSIVRNLAGQRISDTVTAGPMPRMDGASSRANAYDAADRLVSSVDGAGVADSFVHDGNGALLSAETANGRVEFTYDGEHQVSSIDTGTASDACAYDALGNRIRMGGHLWVPDFNDSLKRPLMECSADGTVLRYYIWANGALVGFIDASGVLTVVHCDDYASVVALTDGSGNVLHTAVYGPHGEDWGRTGTNPTPFAWMGGYGVQRYDGGFLGDLYVTRHRLYSPRQNRFLSSDPMGLAGGLNLYAYCGGNPMAYVDPMGLCKEKGFWQGMGDELGDTLIGIVDLAAVSVNPFMGMIRSGYEVRMLMDDPDQYIQSRVDMLSQAWNGTTDFLSRAKSGNLTTYELGRLSMFAIETVLTAGIGGAVSKGGSAASKLSEAGSAASKLSGAGNTVGKTSRGMQYAVQQMEDIGSKAAKGNVSNPISRGIKNDITINPNPGGNPGSNPNPFYTPPRKEPGPTNPIKTPSEPLFPNANPMRPPATEPHKIDIDAKINMR